MTRQRPLASTAYNFPNLRAVYHGKVRDVYDFGDSLMMVATDRYSAFDRNLAVVHSKGELLTAISRWWFEQTAEIVPNHVKGYPDPNVTWCNKYEVVPIEMVVRGYITGVTTTSLWHAYQQGQRDFGDFVLPEGLYKNAKLPAAVLTPTTKLEKHDRNLTPQQAVDEGLVSAAVWEKMKCIALELFSFGQETAAAKGLILVDTKYEFGLDGLGNLILIDEIHTPDSSRYWLAATYPQRIRDDEEPDYYDKEFLRLWFKERFDPYEDTEAPVPPDELLEELRNRYIYVYEHLLEKKFAPTADGDLSSRIKRNIIAALETA
ncbi:MAG TPA: phosphoribosylaminoimidazolesuccinocarboxamide synthase [Candidatus Saccharimonadales bacterium]|nr:phosphoribosylaminoimidazolesuccinocarboxamide synthase [Candidatus Saccharimonadales bacterium]